MRAVIRDIDVTIGPWIRAFPHRIRTTSRLKYAYRNGRCAVFARALHLELGYRIDASFNAGLEDTETEEDCLVHVFCVAPDGLWYDVGGRITLQWMKDRMAFWDPEDGEGSCWIDQNLSDGELQALIESTVGEPYPGEVEALRRLIRANPELYGAGAQPQGDVGELRAG